MSLENARLKETIAEYRSEFTEMKNQEGTVKSLKDQIRELEQSTDATVEKRVMQALADQEKKLAADELASSGQQSALKARLRQAMQEVNGVSPETPVSALLLLLLTLKSCKQSWSSW